MTKRESIHAKYSGHCSYCGETITLKEMQIDHIVPKLKGGGDELDNLNPACRACNFYKGSETIEQFKEMLSTIPARLEKLFIFRLAVKYGLISINKKEIKFYYEKSADVKMQEEL